MGVTINKRQKENILEYQSDSHCHTMICSNQEMYVASEVDKWLFPGKIYTIPTGIRLWLPENSVVMLTRCPWLNQKIEVIPQIIMNDSFVCVQVRNIGILPTKIQEEEMLGALTVVPRLECHIINVRG